MIRTVISLDPEDKEWLEQKAKEERVPIARLVRRAVRRYREECELSSPSLEETAGLWKAGDGLAYQHRIREEWQEER
jgi:hypothetical protein